MLQVCLRGIIGFLADTLVENGKVDTRKLQAHKISETDLLEEPLVNGKVNDVSKIRKGILERNGKTSIIPDSGNGH